MVDLGVFILFLASEFTICYQVIHNNNNLKKNLCDLNHACYKDNILQAPEQSSPNFIQSPMMCS